MIKAVLFDLDGTLLKLDVDDFLPRYIKALSYWVKDHIPMEQFPTSLIEATNVMIKDNNPATTNEQVFMDSFFSITKGKREELEPVFNQFYIDEFPKLAPDYTGAKGAQELIGHCKAKGIKMVVATNPVFPMQAVKERINWAGLNQDDFDLITSYEEMHFCKPNVNYYKEILNKINTSPEDTLMVGNDCQEDMVAADLGIKTFLVDDFVIDRGKPYKADYMGKLSDVKKII